MTPGSDSVKVTVLIPVYNCAAHLRQSVDSILAQTFQNFEILLIDDCSADGSREIVRMYAEKDARVRAVLHSKNIGLAATLNEGIELAKGEYIARLDQDDEALPRRLEYQVTYLDANNDVALVGGQPFNMGATPEHDKRVYLPTDPAEIAERLPRENCIYHPAVMYRREVVRALGGYRTEFKNAEDYDLWLRISLNHRLANLSEPVIRYRLNVSGMSYSRRWEQLRYVYLAQEANQYPDLPIANLEPAVEGKLAATDRAEFFDAVASYSVKELLEVGFTQEARGMYECLKGELSKTTKTSLQALLEGADYKPAISQGFWRRFINGLQKGKNTSPKGV